jgi:hypothetical protein
MFKQKKKRTLGLKAQNNNSSIFTVNWKKHFQWKNTCLMILKSTIKKNDRTFEAKRLKTQYSHITRYLFYILFYIIINKFLFMIFISYMSLC